MVIIVEHDKVNVKLYHMVGKESIKNLDSPNNTMFPSIDQFPPNH